LAAFYAGVKIIAEDLGSMPLNLHERSADGKEVNLASSHNLFPILHDLANPEISAGELVETLTAHALLAGNGYAKIERARGTGRVVFLWPLMTDEVRTERDKNKNLIYIHREGNSQDKPYSREQIFHLKGFTLDGYSGDAILQRARHVLGLGQAQQEYAGRFFAQDATPGLVIKRPAEATVLGPEAVAGLKKLWKEWHQGTSSSHEPAILQEGTTVESLTPDHDKMQLIEQRTFQILEVCRLLRMPPHKLAELTHATFSNIQELGIQYVTDTISPWARRWKDAIHRCLLTREEQVAGRLYAEHNLEALQRGDFKAQSEGYARLLEKGVWSINEVRRLLNQNPVPGGDKHYVQLNMQSIADAATGAVIAQGSKLIRIQGGDADDEGKGRVNGQELLTGGD